MAMMAKCHSKAKSEMSISIRDGDRCPLWARCPRMFRMPMLMSIFHDVLLNTVVNSKMPTLDVTPLTNDVKVVLTTFVLIVTLLADDVGKVRWTRR